MCPLNRGKSTVSLWWRTIIYHRDNGGITELYRGLNNLQLIAARIAHIKSWRAWIRTRVGNNLNARFAESFRRFDQIRNCEANMPRTQPPALFVLDRPMP